MLSFSFLALFTAAVIANKTQGYSSIKILLKPSLMASLWEASWMPEEGKQKKFIKAFNFVEKFNENIRNY